MCTTGWRCVSRCVSSGTTWAYAVAGSWTKVETNLIASATRIGCAFGCIAACSSGSTWLPKNSSRLTSWFVWVAPSFAVPPLSVSAITRYIAASFAFQFAAGDAACCWRWAM